MGHHKEHYYSAKLTWTGNRGEGTAAYDAYGREHVISIAGKPDLQGSSDTIFRGDASRHNPEDMFLASLSACHMLWYLHLCADHGIVVTGYVDEPRGTLVLEEKGGHFSSVVLHPRVTITDRSKIETAQSLHVLANEHCFIANSCNFPVTHISTCEAEN